MEFTDIKHIPFGEISDFDADIFFAGCGYETRSVCIPRMLSNISCRRIALCFTEHTRDISRPENELFYKENNYELHNYSGQDIPDYDQFFKVFNKRELNVMVDISVMTRTWYYSLLKYLQKLKGFRRITLKLIYCPAIYSSPAKTKSKVTLKDLWFLDEPNESPKRKKEKALILGMGNEKGLSQRVYEQLMPEKTYLLYADPALQLEYVENLFVNNHGLIELIDIKNLKGYPLDNTREIYSLLVDLILPLRETHDIIVVPQGPKIFSLMAMIFQISYPDVCISLPKIKRTQLIDRKPFNQVTSLELIFSQE